MLFWALERVDAIYRQLYIVVSPRCARDDWGVENERLPVSADASGFPLSANLQVCRLRLGGATCIAEKAGTAAERRGRQVGQQRMLEKGRGSLKSLRPGVETLRMATCVERAQRFTIAPPNPMGSQAITI
jgi:hypothetical protein